ncbi:MAG: radical SAM protein [Mariprofundaceae bacterium]|nr:radical SAM protein [Mariprofundaceae bacterium]
MNKKQLTTKNHDRDAVGMCYVYPVISRRAGGVSIGINLNPNNACNWHCAYCQVPNLTRGVAPNIDLALLRHELTVMLGEIIRGDFMQRRVPEACRKLCDIAISGNGEPTSCRSFDDVIQLIVDVMDDFHLLGKLPLRLISNGSYIRKMNVQNGLKLMAKYHGEVWVKVDATRGDTIYRMNGVRTSAELLFQQVVSMAQLCPSWIQTCMLAWDGEPPSNVDIAAYLSFLNRLKEEQVAVRGVLLYGLARPSLQPEAKHVSALDKLWMQDMRDRIQTMGFPVRLNL